MWDAAMWRRNRDLEALAYVAVRLINRIPVFGDASAVQTRELLEGMPLYEDSMAAVEDVDGQG